MGAQITDIVQSKTLFKKWILVNGFEDIHKCIRITLERLYILQTIKKELDSLAVIDIEKSEKELKLKASNFYFDKLVNEVNLLFSQPLQFQKHIESFNSARNCLVHTHGIITTRHCNNSEKTKLTIFGNRFKTFFRKDGQDILAEIGKAGVENASLMLGAEEFEIEFMKETEIERNLKQFLDILNTCVFIRADIDVKLQ